jgi:hypothetical protein
MVEESKNAKIVYNKVRYMGAAHYILVTSESC